MPPLFSASRSPMVFATLHSSGSHHISADAHSMSGRVSPPPSRLQCYTEYPRARSSDLSSLYSTLQCTAACERSWASASRIRGWHTDSWGMSSLRDWRAATPCIWLPGRCVIVDGSQSSTVEPREDRSAVVLICSPSTPDSDHACSSRLHLCAACHYC